MIKLFRKIRQQLLSETKPVFQSGGFRKYILYAFGEIILVVAGILIALQINIWNNKRIDRKTETLFLKQIHEEFTKNREQLAEIVNFHQLTFDQCRKILELCPIDPETVNLDSLGKYIGNAGRRMSFNPSQGSIEALINSSSFDIISNDELRMLLVQWRDVCKDYLDLERLMMDQLNNFYRPYRNKNFPRNLKKLPGFQLNNNRMDLSILQSAEFENQVADRMSYLRNILFEDNLKQVQQSIDEIIRLSTR